MAGALLFCCTGRGAGLFGTADHDVLAVRDGLRAAGVAGFFAAGEIGPVAGRSHLHGFTASVLASCDPALTIRSPWHTARMKSPQPFT